MTSRVFLGTFETAALAKLFVALLETAGGIVGYSRSGANVAVKVDDYFLGDINMFLKAGFTEHPADSDVCDLVSPEKT